VPVIWTVVVIALVVLLLLALAVKVIKQYEQGVLSASAGSSAPGRPASP
jgi:hypothetical protein